jgi:aquaporin Z
MKKIIAEAIGTFTLVFFGCGSAVLKGAEIGMLGISFAFGLAVTAMAYSIGHISGAHLNPAVSIGALMAGKLNAQSFVGYVAAQVLGAVAGAFVLLVIAQGKADYTLAANGLGQNGWGTGYLGEYSMIAALVFEVVATFLFVTVILGATQDTDSSPLAGLVIGLTLVAIHLVGINVTGTSVNPARSIGPAVFVGGTALQQLWLFIAAPLVGGALAGIVFRSGITAK